jgi:hypothetical protein
VAVVDAVYRHALGLGSKNRLAITVGRPGLEHGDRSEVLLDE